MNPYEFKFKGECSGMKGVYLSKTPAVLKPKMRSNQIVINGVAGCSIEKLGYEAYSRSFEFYVKNTENIEDVQNWLNGDGELIVFNEPDRIYDASILDEIEYTKSGRFIVGKVNFLVQPYKRALHDDFFELKGNTIKNMGNVKSLPVIDITGTGDVRVAINQSTVCTLKLGVSERTLRLDAQCKDCFYNGSLANRSMSGRFPELAPGINILETTGNVTKIKYRKGERWI